MVTITPSQSLQITCHHDQGMPQNQPLSPRVQVHPLPSADGLLLQIQPPKQPRLSTRPDAIRGHVPCDIVLAIDVSNSMGEHAPVPGDTTERTGLTVLDLVKHAARTIVATLNERDRLGIVTFDAVAVARQRLVPMTLVNKQHTETVLQGLAPGSTTNLWHGITEGLKLFTEGSASENVPALLVLTDGRPNHMHPQPGYIPKLRKMQPFEPTIHTFGFGYRLRSGLLKSISELTGGNYFFIPDAGMIGTALVHAIANLQSTFATQTVLRITYPKSMALQETAGEAVNQEPARSVGNDHSELTIRLGNLQYGQSRDIYLRAKWNNQSEDGKAPVVSAALEYRLGGKRTHCPTTTRSVLRTTSLTPEDIAYHLSRSAIVSYLASLQPLDAFDEHQPRKTDKHEETQSQLETLIHTIPAREFPEDPRNKSLMLDLAGPSPYGQLSLALDRRHYTRWGQHYLASLAGAHARQICNSFRDPGPLLYSAESPLFTRCRDALDTAFESLPPPQPTRTPTTKYRHEMNMRAYHSRRTDEPCFASCSMVELAHEVHGDIMGKAKMIPVKRLRAGMSVRTPQGARRVAAVLRTPVRRCRMALLGDLIITPWHPVSRDGETWTFPGHIAPRSVWYTGAIYSVLLQRDVDVDAGALRIGGLWAATLGHGLLVDAAPVADPRAHIFLGDYDAVVKAFSRLQRTRHGLFLSAGVHRDAQTGLVDGFLRAPATRRNKSSGKTRYP